MNKIESRHRLIVQSIISEENSDPTRIAGQPRLERHHRDPVYPLKECQILESSKINEGDSSYYAIVALPISLGKPTAFLEDALVMLRPSKPSSR